MRRLTMYATALLVALMASVVVGQQVAAPMDLDATMKRVGPATGAAAKGISSMAFADARMQIPTIRTGIQEAEAFFVRRKKEDAVKFAKEVQAKLDALDTALTAAETAAASGGGTYAGTVDVDAAMKRVGPAAGGAGKAVASMAYADARTQLAVARAGVAEAHTFFTARNTADGVKFADDSLAKMDALDKILAGTTVDQPAALAAVKEMQGTCGACHTAFRVRDEMMNFVLRPGAAPAAPQQAAQAAMRDVQTACTTCHTAYRSNQRGDWILRPGS